MDQAKAKGNALDTQSFPKTERLTLRASYFDHKKGVLLNSICLNEASLKPFRNRNRVQDLNGARFMSTLPTKSTQNLIDEVEAKQRELVSLAKLKGTYDKSVLEKQLFLVKTKLFREYAVMLMKIQSESQTPGIDGEIIHDDIKDNATFDNLVQYLREIAYHPNKYKSAPIKRVWIPKPGESELRSIGIPTIKDRALQTLVNLVLLPLVEMNSDPNSYGFRPYRDCKMAVAAVRNQLKTSNLTISKRAINKRFSFHSRIKQDGSSAVLIKANQNKWILDAHIKGFCNNINHEWLMNNICLHPDLKKLLGQWLHGNAKIFDAGLYTDLCPDA